MFTDSHHCVPRNSKSLSGMHRNRNVKPSLQHLELPPINWPYAQPPPAHKPVLLVLAVWLSLPSVLPCSTITVVLACSSSICLLIETGPLACNNIHRGIDYCRLKTGDGPKNKAD